MRQYTTQYFGYHVSGTDLTNPPEQIGSVDPSGDRLAFIVFPHWSGLLGQIERRYPSSNDRG